MSIEELRKQLGETEELLKKIELSYHQTIGKIALLRDLIVKEEQKDK